MRSTRSETCDVLVLPSVRRLVDRPACGGWGRTFTAAIRRQPDAGWPRRLRPCAAGHPPAVAWDSGCRSRMPCGPGTAPARVAGTRSRDPCVGPRLVIVDPGARQSGDAWDRST